MTALEEIKKALEGQRLEKWATHQGLRGTAIVVANNDGSAKRYSDDSRVFEIPTGMPENARYIAAVNPAAITELLSTLESLQRENEELRRDLSHEASHRQKLQNALAYWMPGVTEEIEISTNRRCGDDALLLVGSEGPFDDKCWGNEAIARAEAAEAEVERLQVGVYVETLPAVHLIRVFADDMNERNWDDKRAYIKQQADRIRTALASTGGEHNAE